jgi:hypothetical protein
VEEDQQKPIEGSGMTGLLTVAAVITALILLLSATKTGAQATTSAANQRGSWGIATWTSTRNRALNPHERRWQTSLLSGRDNPSRWKNLVIEIQALEQLSSVVPVGPAPDKHDSGWVEASITNLEQSISESSREQTVSGDTPT